MTIYDDSIKFHKKIKRKLEIKSRVKLNSKRALSLAYTPGVAQPCREIAKDPRKVYDYTIKNNSVAIITDGSAVLGLGNIGAKAALPVMEGKAILFKEFGGIDAYPICLDTQNTNEIISTIKNIAPGFGGINLEDIAAPKCFEIEQAINNLGIPIFHDDQHGTAIVSLAGLMNACKVTSRKLENSKIVVCGAGAAGIAISKMLLGLQGKKGVKLVEDLILCDSKGPIHNKRKDLSNQKKELVKYTNKQNIKTFEESFENADAFLGVSVAGIVKSNMIKKMNKRPIVFAMANPVPEIMPKEAKQAGAEVIGTGRSDFKNQINNVLAFPGVFRGTFDAKASKITSNMKIAAAEALAKKITKPTRDKILPNTLDKKVAKKIALAVKKTALKDNVPSIT